MRVDDEDVCSAASDRIRNAYSVEKNRVTLSRTHAVSCTNSIANASSDRFTTADHLALRECDAEANGHPHQLLAHRFSRQNSVALRPFGNESNSIVF